MQTFLRFCAVIHCVRITCELVWLVSLALRYNVCVQTLPFHEVTSEGGNGEPGKNADMWAGPRQVMRHGMKSVLIYPALL